MIPSQPGIIAPVPAHSRYIELVSIPDRDPLPVLKALAALQAGAGVVVGFGAGFVQGLGQVVEGLHPFLAQSGPGCFAPSTQTDILLWIRGDDRGEIAGLARELLGVTAPAFRVERMTNGFKYQSGLDLSGYEDGTENPQGDAADAAAFSSDGGGIAGSSFVSVQKWVHDLSYFETLDPGLRDDIIGRRISDNVEIDQAPEWAHVKRTAQETFSPEAFVLRRSMPWSDPTGEGLMFVAFGNSFEAFEAQLARMTGQEDGIIDGLFRFSRPVTGSNFWCPPTDGNQLDLSLIGV